MFQIFNKKPKNKPTEIDKESVVDKNLKMMTLSAGILIALFIYTTIKSDSVIQGESYYTGMGFLFILLILSLSVQRYKKKLQNLIPKNKFQENLEDVKDKPNTQIKEVGKNILFNKKFIDNLTLEQKEILKIYQAGKSFISGDEIDLYDINYKQEEIIFPTKSQLEKQMKIYLAGFVTVEIIKNEIYIVNEQDLIDAYHLADKIVDIYKLEVDAEKFILGLKQKLRENITNNLDLIKSKYDL